MRRITLWLMATISLIVLLFTYSTSTNKVTAVSNVASTSAVSTPPATSSGATSSGSTSSGATSSGSTGSSTPTATSYTGTAVDTQYGPVQVRITVVNGKITASQAVQYPSESGRDQEINSQAVPQLNAEVVQQQSAKIDMVSGATYTSTGYTQSLQAAIDAAKL